MKKPTIAEFIAPFAAYTKFVVFAPNNDEKGNLIDFHPRTGILWVDELRELTDLMDKEVWLATPAIGHISIYYR